MPIFLYVNIDMFRNRNYVFKERYSTLICVVRRYKHLFKDIRTVWNTHYLFENGNQREELKSRCKKRKGNRRCNVNRRTSRGKKKIGSE